MPFNDPKLILALCAAVIGFVSYFIYIRDIFRGRTKPHLYTWVIWTMTTGTFAVAVFTGGGGWGSLGPMVNFLFTFSTLALALKYGTKNITRSDALSLIAAFAAIIIWWQLDNPLLAVVVATAVDLIGYIPTFRKSYAEPWTENLWSWGVWAVGVIFTILALDAYNALTLTSNIAITAANIALITMLILRRRAIPKPVQSAVG